MQQPLLSVIIPVFNRSEYLAEAITSVLDQQVGGIEIVVVDDGSGFVHSAKIQRVSERLGAKLHVNTQNLGVSASRNVGIRLCRGRYVIFLDDDDWLAPGFVANALAGMSGAVRVLMARSELVSASDTRRFRQLKTYHTYLQQKYHCRPTSDYHYFLVYCPAIHCIIWDRRCFDLHVFNESVRYGEDRELLLRMNQSGILMKSLDRIGGYYRLTKGSHAFNQSKFLDILLEEQLISGISAKSYCHLLKAYFYINNGKKLRAVGEFLKSLISPGTLLQQFQLFLRIKLVR